ncbi:hypothetical protein [Burkholderia sp. PU8-34]
MSACDTTIFCFALSHHSYVYVVVTDVPGPVVGRCSTRVTVPSAIRVYVVVCCATLSRSDLNWPSPSQSRSRSTSRVVPSRSYDL